MGQRHQAFAIAKVIPHGSTDGKAYYRCVAAFHDQYCQGTFPLRATRRFLTVIKQNDNAEIIRAELRSIQGKYSRPESRSEPVAPDLPCPYICFLLATCWSVDLIDPENTYSHGVSFESGALFADMMSDDGDNNDGISVIDVTDPSNSSYCFVFIYGANRNVPCYVPLTATQYVRDYFPLPDEEEVLEGMRALQEDSVLEAIAALDGERVIDLGMLAEAWPEYRKNWKKAQRKHPRRSASLVASPVESVLIPSLTELTLKPALDHALEIGDTHQLEELVWMQDKGNALRAALLDRDDKPFPDSGVPLLIKILGEARTNVLDLSGIHLFAQQIIDIVSQTHTRATLETLKLSGNTVITAEGICDIFCAIPTIRRLWLLDTNISSEDMMCSLRDQPEAFYGIETIVHPAFMTIHSTSPYPTAFRLTTQGYAAHASFSLPFFTPSSILQSLMDILAGFAYGTVRNTYLLDSAMVPHVALASSRYEGQKWSERFVHLIPHWQDSPENHTAEEGWGCVIKNVPMGYGKPRRKQYAFTKTLVVATEPSTAGISEMTESETEKSAETTAKIAIYDLDSFLKAMREEGRPEPSESLVKTFADVLKKLEEGDAKFMMDGKGLMETLCV